MLYVGVFLLGITMGVVFMAFIAGASRNNQCEDCYLEGPALPILPPIHEDSEPNQSKEEMTEGPKGWTHEDMISQGG